MTYDELATDERSLPRTGGVPVAAGTSPAVPAAQGRGREKAHKLLSNIVTMATDQKAIYEVMLSTGLILEGYLSPFDDESDHIRVNPIVRRRGHTSLLLNTSSMFTGKETCSRLPRPRGRNGGGPGRAAGRPRRCVPGVQGAGIRLVLKPDFACALRFGAAGSTVAAEVAGI